MPALLSVQDLSYRYPKSSAMALEGVSLEIPRGSFFALLGPNGAGKTTLLRLVCGRLSGYKGSLTVAEECRSPSGFLDPHHYGVLLENPGTYIRLTVGEYLHYFAGFYGIEKKVVDELGKEILDKLKGPSWNMKLSGLSLGNRQKLQIVRALIHRPQVLILDEPVANLDPESREMVWDYIGGWRKAFGGTAIVCSHILAEMDAVATDFAIIDEGKILRQGTLREERAKVDKATTRFDVELPGLVEESELLRILAAAKMNPVKLRLCRTSLSDIYRETIKR